jgi:hypothetical protein
MFAAESEMQRKACVGIAPDEAFKKIMEDILLTAPVRRIIKSRCVVTGDRSNYIPKEEYCHG